MGPNNREKWGYPFMILGAALILLDTFGYAQNDNKFIPIATLVGGFLIGAWGSYDNRTHHRPAIPEHEQHDPMKNKKGKVDY